MPRIIISEPGKTPQPYRLKADRIVTKIGRGSDNDVIITTGSASTHHCKMKRVEGGFILADNDSTNGIKLEDTRYSIIDLKDGMTVQIGDDIDMEFTLSDEEKEILEHEDFEPQQRASFPKSKKKTKAKVEPPVEDEDDEEDEEKEEKEEYDDDAIVLEEAKPKSSNKRSKKNKPRVNTDTDRPLNTGRSVAVKTSSGLSFIIFIILAILFFMGGLAIRHYQDHKTFIFSK